MSDEIGCRPESIVRRQHHVFQVSHAHAIRRHGIGNNDIIRIPVQQQDVFTLPSERFLYIEGKLTEKGDNVTDGLKVNMINNAMMFVFEEIRYEIVGVEVDRLKNVGITFTMKNL